MNTIRELIGIGNMEWMVQMTSKKYPHVLGNKEKRAYEIRVFEIDDGFKRIVEQRNKSCKPIVKKKDCTIETMAAMKEKFLVLKEIGAVYNEIFA